MTHFYKYITHNYYESLFSWSVGYVAIAVYSYGTRFDIIAPEDGVFFDDCYVLQYGYCRGVYFGHKNNTLVDTLVSILSQPPIFEGEIKYCGSHSSIEGFGITCSPSKTRIHGCILVLGSFEGFTNIMSLDIP